MDIWAILTVLWNIISSLSVIITLLCFIYPAGAYPIISFAFKKIKERKLNQTKLNITLIYDFKCLDVDLNTPFKEEIDDLFNNYGLISEQKGNLIKGNFKRRNFYIRSKFRLPLLEENNLHFTQHTEVPFKQLTNCMLSLFDNIRELSKLNYVQYPNEKVNIRIKTSFLNKNKLIKLLGPNIQSNVSIRTESGEVVIIFNEELTGESIDFVKNIIISLAEI